MPLSRRCLTLVLVVLVLVGTALSLVSIGCSRVEEGLVWSHEFSGDELYVWYDQQAKELLLIHGQKLYGLGLGSAVNSSSEPALRCYDKYLSTYRNAFVPLVGYFGSTRRVMSLYVDGSQVKGLLYQGDNGEVIRDWATQEQDLFREMAAQNDAFVPVMFRKQSYSFGEPGHWYRLDIMAEEAGQESSDCAYQLTLERLAVEPPQLMVATSPGYSTTVSERGLTVWVYDEWSETKLAGVDVVELAEAAAEEFRGFFGLEFDPPLNLVLGPSSLSSGLRLAGKGFDGEMTEAYSRAAIYHYWQPLIRHELAHALHNAALLPQSYFGSVPLWASEGLAIYFEAGSASLNLTGVHRLTPFSADMDPGFLNEHPNFYQFGSVIMDHLLGQYDHEIVVRYLTHPRGLSGDEDGLTKELFGLTQMELLVEALNSPGNVGDPAVDYRLADFTVLTRYSHRLRGDFVASPGGMKLAFVSGDSSGRLAIRVLNVNTGLTREVISADDVPGCIVLGCLSWFPDEERILFRAVTEDGDHDIYSVSLSGDGTLAEVLVAETLDSGASVSPDGTRIAFRSERTGSSEIYCMDLASGDTTQLTSEGTNLIWPVWSPQEDRIAFVDPRQNRLGVTAAEPGEVHWFGLESHAVVPGRCRPQWLSEDEVMVPVLLDGEHPGLVSINLLTGEINLWGGTDLTAYVVTVAPGDNQFYVRTRLFDPYVELLYMGLVRVTLRP